MAGEDAQCNAALIGNPRKRSYVTLAQNTGSSMSNTDDDSVVVGTRVSHKAARRSGLLAGIKDTEGLASLPGRLSPEDVKLWETACVLNIETCVDELVTILQVADALGDPSDHKWVSSLAEKALATDWAAADEADAMLCGLLRLPPHLLHRVLSACLSTQLHSGWSGPAMLDTFPAPLHLAIVSAMISTSNLSITQESATTILTQLPAASAPDAGLRTLSLTNENPWHNRMAAATGVLLARAVVAHPSLTSLSLDRQPPKLLHTFSACLPLSALPNLAALHVCTDALPGGCVEVAACLSLLSSLTSLTVKLALNPPCAANEASLSSYAQLAANPATLPHLQTLDFYEFVDRQTDSRECDGCANAFLQLISTPALTRLFLKICPTRSPFPALVPEITAERFPVLQHLSLSGALKAEVLSSMQRLALGGISFPPVNQVTIESACPASVRRIASALCQCFSSSLTTLSMTLNSEVSGPHDDSCTVRMAQLAWSPFWGILGACTALKSLDLVCLSTPWHTNGVSFSRSLGQALERLTQLTNLQLSCGLGPAVSDLPAVALNGATVGAALSTLTDLRVLSMHSHEQMIQFDSLQPVMDACANLKRLEGVELCFEGVKLQEVRDLVPRLNAVTTVVLLGGLAGEDSDGFEALVTRFPSIDFVLE